MKKILEVALLAALLAGTQGTALAAQSRSCDRDCLKHVVDTYLAALVAHDPKHAPLSPHVKFVENTIPMKVGEGFWKSAQSGPTDFRIYVPDPTAQQVGFIGMMTEDNKPVQIALRLKLQNGKIVEAEHLLARNLRDTSLPNLQTVRPAFFAGVPMAERSSREELLKIGASYYDALVNSDGKAAPFADDCLRRENGMQTTGNPPPAKPGRGTMGAMGCAAQLDTRTMSYIKRIEPRRVWIGDVETGLVFGLSQFRHPMEEKTLKIVGVPGVESVPMDFKPFDLPAAHIYKIRAGRIHEIEAMGFTMPYNSKTGWE